MNDFNSTVQTIQSEIRDRRKLGLPTAALIEELRDLQKKEQEDKTDAHEP